MRNLIALAMVGISTLAVGAVQAADMPYYPPVIEVPDVDIELGGSFYLRGSAALNLHWAKEAVHLNAAPGFQIWPIDTYGYGYSVGGGFGYETGTGLRVDATIDQLETTGLSITKSGMVDPAADGKYTMMLRSTLALANVYYDFGLGGDSFSYSGSGAFGYVGAGAGVAWNHVETNAPVGNSVPSGGNVSAAAALMAGVGFDMGTWVADVGYRGVYINQINNAPTADPDYYYNVDHNFIHEVRGSVRYRFN
jgi:hypothetical protein